MRTLGLVLLVTLLVSLAAAGTDLPDEMAPFRHLVGTSWVGRFVSTPAPPFDHEIEWKSILNGHAVQWSKRVEALDFGMETFFFWDAGMEVIAFTQLSSNGIHARGTVALENEILVLTGTSTRPSGQIGFRQTFEIMPDGTLEDRYYRREGDRWMPEHVIAYTPVIRGHNT